MYFITAVKSHPYPPNHRTFGYFEDHRSAREAIKNNYGDMYEYYYDFLVLEKIGVGIHPDVESETWFQWVNSVGEWRQVEKPSWALCTNWALG
jgi:hypothetical protein